MNYTKIVATFFPGGHPLSPEVAYGILTSENGGELQKTLGVCGDEEQVKVPLQTLLAELASEDAENRARVLGKHDLPYVELCYMAAEAAAQHFIACPKEWAALPLGTRVKIGYYNHFVLVITGRAFLFFVPEECVDTTR